MKRILSLALVLMLVLALAACAPKAPAPSASPSAPADSAVPSEPVTPDEGLKDGTYKAQSLGFDKSGYQYFVELTVKDGKIANAVCDAVNAENVLKSTLSKEGKYDMKNNGLLWHEQAEAYAAKLVEVQDPAAIPLNAEGKTDAITGVSVTVSEFSKLAMRALSQAKGEPQGPLKDGEYTEESANFDENSGYKDNVTIKVEDGLIVSVNWDATHKDGGDTKKARSISGEYDMKNEGLKWHEQAAAMENALLYFQDASKIALSSEGTPDAVSGVSIHVNAFVELAAKAISAAK